MIISELTLLCFLRLKWKDFLRSQIFDENHEFALEGPNCISAIRWQKTRRVLRTTNKEDETETIEIENCMRTASGTRFWENGHLLC